MSKNMHIPGWPESAAAMPSAGSSNFNNTFTSGMASGMDFIKNFWGNSSGGVPGFVVPTIDLKELEKRIKDLKAVEGWLDVNINMLRTTIQALEVQHSTIATIHAMSDTFSANTADAAKGMMAAMPSAAPSSSASSTTAFRPTTETAKPRKRQPKAQANSGLPPGWPTPASTKPAPETKVKPVTVMPEADVPLSAKPSPSVAAKVPAKPTSKAAATATPAEPSAMARGAEQAAASAGAWLNFMQDQFSKVTAATMSGTDKTTSKTATKKSAAKTRPKPPVKSRDQ